MHDLIGTWRLVKTHAFDEHGTPITPPYGPKPMGLAMFHADGRMMAVLNDSRQDLPPGTGAYMSYCGRYVVDGDTLRTRVDGSSEASRVGGEQVRTVAFEKDLLKLSPPLRSWGGSLQQHVLYWEKIG
ncbi:MAG: lipocalin-like domain-containing protein [Burkholderiales bacterium]